MHIKPQNLNLLLHRSTKENCKKEKVVVHEKKEKRQYLNSTSVHDLWTLYRFIRYYKTNNGTSLAEPFLDLPLKKELPDYYLLIAKPISLSIIRKKLKSGNYAVIGTEGLMADMNLMFENCKSYNISDSRLFKDACKLQKVLKRRYEKSKKIIYMYSLKELSNQGLSNHRIRDTVFPKIVSGETKFYYISRWGN